MVRAVITKVDGYLDALAYMCIHNTNALNYFNQMCVYIYDIKKDPFALFILLPAMFFFFCYPWNRCIFSHKRGLIK